MSVKNKEVLRLRNQQAVMKKEIEKLKVKVPEYAVAYILLVALFIYFFDGKLYHYFDGSINFIKISVLLFGCIGIILLYKAYQKIKKKEREIFKVQAKLYKLMRLEDKNE